MGVVRDITVEQLISAIGDIDTSGLAKDTTLQATNTALGNINTTLGGITTNDPPTDTTQQSIAAAISGLGTTLGSDKANIDGSNIANPSAFRSNIGCEWTSFENVISDPNNNVEDIILKKCNNVVYVSLTTKQKTFNENDVLFTITNSALIPTNIQRLVCWSYAADKCYTISIKTNGIVDCYGKGTITGRLIFYGFYFTL